jgi:hypothetical protein|tara:strand:- start:351 stop:461 length:111 start_codon:yes stop_codon:yes gene_type:complete
MSQQFVNAMLDEVFKKVFGAIPPKGLELKKQLEKES